MAQTLLARWLQSAHALEKGQIRLLEQMSQDFERYPDIRSELRQHLLETKQQLDDVQECLENLGSHPGSTATPYPLFAAAAGDDELPATDKLVRELQLLYANEQYEHITYLALAEAARHSGEDEIADICERIAEEEVAMAEWIEEQLPAVITARMTVLDDEM